MPSIFMRDNPIFSSERTIIAAVKLKKILVVGLKGLDAKRNGFAVNRQL
jgi:hypothetical protein